MCVLVSYETETDTVLCRIYASGIWGNGCQHPDGVEELCVLKISVLEPEKASIYLELHLTSPPSQTNLAVHVCIDIIIILCNFTCFVSDFQ